MQFVIETRRKLTIERRGQVQKQLCQHCNQLVAWVTPEEAVILTGISSRKVYQMVEFGQAHFTETSEGFLMVCLSSLSANWRQKSSVVWPLITTSLKTVTESAGLRPRPKGRSEPFATVIGSDSISDSKSLLPWPTGRSEPTNTIIGSDSLPLRLDKKLKGAVWEFNHQAFVELLASLDADPEFAAQKFIALRERLAKFFECRGCNATLDLADETINCVARQLSESELTRTPNQAVYFYSIARSILREYEQSQKLPLSKHSELTTANNEKNASDDKKLELLLDYLNTCLQELPDATRQLLLEYHRHDNHSRTETHLAIASRLGTTLNALKIRIRRFRANLRRRINQLLKEQTR